MCIYDAFTLLDVIRSVRLISPARWDENDALFSRTSIDARAIEDRDGRDIKLSLSLSLSVFFSRRKEERRSLCLLKVFSTLSRKVKFQSGGEI